MLFAHKLFDRNLQISIHALREEGDFWIIVVASGGDSDFYPRPPRGGRPTATGGYCSAQVISIHALREEGDGFLPTFQPLDS